jgi:hypothetical protein
VLAWLEAGLDGHLEAPRAAPSPDLEQRLAAVEQRLAAIAAQQAEPLAMHGGERSRSSDRTSGEESRVDNVHFSVVKGDIITVNGKDESGPDNIMSTELRYHGNLCPESPTSQSTTEESRRDVINFSLGDTNPTFSAIADFAIPSQGLPSSAQVLTTGELADRLTVKRNALNERLRRAGGARLGFELDGWRCVGKAKPARGGPAQWQWAPIG